MPVEALPEVPFAPLSKLPTHKKQLFARVTPHIAKEGTQIRETLPEVPRHLINQGTFDVHDLVMGKWQDKVFGVSIHQRECNIVVMVTPVDWVHMHILQHIVHPPHVPLHTKP